MLGPPMTRRANIAISHVTNRVLTGPTEHRDADAPALDAAVPGWYEGHAEGGGLLRSRPQMPTMFPPRHAVAPLPAPGPDSPVRKVAAEVNDRCDPADLDGRVALAAALGWIGGWAEGRGCPVARRAGVRPLKGPPACVRANASMWLVSVRDGDAVVAARPR
jgi:hypothetical protein